MCVTSPPYLNSFDYTDIYRPHLFLGGFVKTAKDLRALRLRTLRSHVQVSWPDPVGLRLPKQLESEIREVSSRAEALWDRRIPNMVRAYFEDMHTLLAVLTKRAYKRSILWLIVSTSAYAGVEIPVDVHIAEITQSMGWDTEAIILLRNLRASGHHWKRYRKANGDVEHLRESLIVLAKN